MPTIFREGLFDGHVAIVTGGGSGIGLAIAQALCELGASVAILGRKQERLEAAVSAWGPRRDRVLALPCDIREPERVAEAVGQVRNTLGEVSVLINNAGGQFPTPAAHMSAKGFDAVIRNNLSGTFYMTREVATQSMLVTRRGSIVNIIANIRRGFPGMAHTGAARAGVENLTKTLAIEWASKQVRVNAIAPGTIRSTGTDQYPPELLELARKNCPQKRLGTPEEVAQLVLYLASDAASFVTGETWYIDGGASLWGDNWIVEDPEESVALPRVLEELGRRAP